MTPDIHFNRWMKRAAILFLLVLAYLLFIDIALPLTSYAMVQRPVVTVAPQVSGVVTDVLVENNAQVNKGDVLFRIDARDYRLALEKAELALSQVSQTNAALKAQLAQAEAAVQEADVAVTEAQRELQRAESLHQRKLSSQQALDQAQTRLDSAKAHYQAALESRNATRVQLGDDGEDNLRVRQARNALAQAQLNLSRTTVVAPEAGVVSNLQLLPGTQANAGQSLISLVASGDGRIAADYREKSLLNIDPNAAAWVVFDALPGEVVHAHLDSRDMGVAKGQLLANGQLAQPDDSDRWVRDAQRVRVYLQADAGALPNALVSGSRATVMMSASDSGLLAWLAAAQMHIISWLRYVY